MAKYEELNPVTDSGALLSIRSLERDGAISVGVFEHDGYRILKSHDPSGPNGEFEFHVSVSRNRSQVSWDIAEDYASAIFPTVEKWQRYLSHGYATHLFEIR